MLSTRVSWLLSHHCMHWVDWIDWCLTRRICFLLLDIIDYELKSLINYVEFFAYLCAWQSRYLSSSSWNWEIYCISRDRKVCVQTMIDRIYNIACKLWMSSTTIDSRMINCWTRLWEFACVTWSFEDLSTLNLNQRLSLVIFVMCDQKSLIECSSLDWMQSFITTSSLTRNDKKWLLHEMRMSRVYSSWLRRHWALIFITFSFVKSFMSMLSMSCSITIKKQNESSEMNRLQFAWHCSQTIESSIEIKISRVIFYARIVKKWLDFCMINFVYVNNLQSIWTTTKRLHAKRFATLRKLVSIVMYAWWRFHSRFEANFWRLQRFKVRSTSSLSCLLEVLSCRFSLKTH